MAKKLWGGRFTKKTDPLVEEFTKSIQYDYKLAKYDLIGTIFHIMILKKAGYLTLEEFKKFDLAIDSIYDNIMKTAKSDKRSEDIHTHIQNLLQRKVKELVFKLHMARSRNDQVVFASKIYCSMEVQELTIDILKFNDTLAKLAKENKDIIIPGFTHLQHAQPIWLMDYLLAYVHMFQRDEQRLDNFLKSLQITLGAGALAGTPMDASNYNISGSKVLEIQKDFVEAFNVKPTTNSLDTISDRDFVIEIISALSIIAMHLSRLAEDLIIWSTKEFDFVEIDESFCTGSSLMPQKKNPDVLELIRGYTGRLYGNLVSVLTMMKGLPLTYNRDMQLDKEPLFSSFEIVSSELKVLTGLIKTLKFNEAKIKEYLKDEGLYATDLVYHLVKEKKIPFKEAHTIIGKLVKYSLDNGIQIKDMPESLLKKFSDKLVKKEIVKLFDPLVSVKSKKSIKR